VSNDEIEANFSAIRGQQFALTYVIASMLKAIAPEYVERVLEASEAYLSNEDLQKEGAAAARHVIQTLRLQYRAS
jgi:hypothetical protein